MKKTRHIAHSNFLNFMLDLPGLTLHGRFEQQCYRRLAAGAPGQGLPALDLYQFMLR
jgi:hypothetical protein